MKIRIWILACMLSGILGNHLTAQNIPILESYKCVKVTALYQGQTLTKINLQPGDIVDAYPSLKGNGWLKVIIDDQVYDAPMDNFVLKGVPTKKVTYKTHKDITGKVSYRPAGGHKTLDGKWIPKTIEEQQAAMELGTWETTTKTSPYLLETAEEITNKRAKIMRTKRGLGEEQFNKMPPVQKHEILESAYDLNTEDGHWLKSNIGDGKYLLLEDGTLYEVDPIDRIDSSLWLPLSNLKIVYDGGLYDYLIINTDDEESVHAKKVLR